MILDKDGDPVDDRRWELIDLIVKTFIRTFPGTYFNFVKEMEGVRGEVDSGYAVATKNDKELRKSGFHEVCRFPNSDLLDQIQKHLPGLGVSVRRYSSIKKLMKEFLRRYPQFKTSNKY